MTNTEAAATPRSVVVERELPHAPEKIWRALTQPHLIQEWLMQSDFKPQVGHKFTFRAPANPHWNGVTACEVLIVEPLKRLSYTWNATGEEAATGPMTTVTWTLTPTKGGVLLRMEQSGFRPDQQNNIQGAAYGWQRFLAALEQVTAKLGDEETKSIVVERLMPHPPEKIWRALTTSELIADWLMKNDFSLERGRKFQFRATPVPGWSGVTNCEVVEFEAPKRLVYRWGDGTESDSGLRTLVTWTLTPADGGTMVRMEHSGFRPQDEGGYRGMGGGWPGIVERLQRIVAQSH